MDVRRRQIKVISKWLCYTLLFVLAAILQTTPGFLKIGGVKPILILPLCLAVAICEGEFSGAIFAAVGGLVWDMLAGRVMGFFALSVMLCAFGVSIIAQLYLKENSTNFILLTGASCFIITGCDFLFGYVMTEYPNALIYYISVVLPMIIFTAVLAPIFLKAAKKISQKFSLEA